MTPSIESALAKVERACPCRQDPRPCCIGPDEAWACECWLDAMKDRVGWAEIHPEDCRWLGHHVIADLRRVLNEERKGRLGQVLDSPPFDFEGQGD